MKRRTDYDDNEYRLLATMLKEREVEDRLLPIHQKINSAIDACIARNMTIRPRKLLGISAARNVLREIDRVMLTSAVSTIPLSVAPAAPMPTFIATVVPTVLKLSPADAVNMIPFLKSGSVIELI